MQDSSGGIYNMNGTKKIKNLTKNYLSHLRHGKY